ncbi:MAG: CAP domain-containing protein [Burkholderiaceae bacterium]
MGRLWTMCGVALSTVGLAACGGGGGDSEATARGPVSANAGTVDVSTVQLPAGLGCDNPDFAAALLNAINEARTQGRQCGGQPYAAVHALPWNTLLAQSAAGHASDMAAQDYFSHTGSDGSHSADRIRATGYRIRFHAEILAHPQGSHSAPSQVIPQSMASWLASPDHCRIVMSPSPAELGAACVRKGSKAWLAVNFGS